MSRPVSLAPQLDPNASSPLTIGAEIEALSDDSDTFPLVNNSIPSSIGYCADGSLSGGNYAQEYQTPPANGEIFTSLIHDLTSALNDNDAYVNDSCGLHIHVSFPYHKVAIKKLILAAIQLEDIFYASQPTKRLTSKYSRPYFLTFTNPYEMFANAEASIVDYLLYRTPSKRTITHRKRERYIREKYYGINVHNIFAGKNTVEFRYHEGSLDADEIIAYATFCQEVVQAILDDNFPDLSDFPTPRSRYKHLQEHLDLPETVTTYFNKRFKKHEKIFLKAKADLLSKREGLLNKLPPNIQKLFSLNTLELSKFIDTEIKLPKDTNSLMRTVEALCSKKYYNDATILQRLNDQVLQKHIRQQRSTSALETRGFFEVVQSCTNTNSNY
jgi:hypothetical protein